MHVIRLDVAMNDVLRVDMFEGARDIERDAQLVAHIACRAVLDGVLQVLTLQKLHHHERSALGIFAEIVNTDDVFVRDVAGQTRLLQETRFGFFVGAAFFGQDFDRHRAADHGVERFIDARHPATEEFLKLVFADARGKLHKGSGRHLGDARQTQRVTALVERRIHLYVHAPSVRHFTSR